MTDTIDAKLSEKMKDALWNGSDTDVISVLEAYFTAHPPEAEQLRLAGGRLTWQDLVSEMRKKTKIGELYLSTFKEAYLFQ